MVLEFVQHLLPVPEFLRHYIMVNVVEDRNDNACASAQWTRSAGIWALKRRIAALPACMMECMSALQPAYSLSVC